MVEPAVIGDWIFEDDLNGQMFPGAQQKTPIFGYGQQLDESHVGLTHQLQSVDHFGRRRRANYQALPSILIDQLGRNVIDKCVAHSSRLTSRVDSPMSRRRRSDWPRTP